MYYIAVLIFCTMPLINAMDVDTGPVRTKKRSAPEPSQPNTSSSSSTAALSDIFMLSDTQKKQCEQVIKIKAVQNAELEASVPLTHIVGLKQYVSPTNDGCMSRRSYIVIKNKKLFAQNNYHRIANDITLKLDAINKSAFSGDQKQQDERFKQLLDDVEQLTRLNDHVHKTWVEPTKEPPLKRHKQQ